MAQVMLQQLMMGAVLWLLMGIGAAVIAQAKGRDFMLWLVIGALGGLIALIVIAALPSNQHSDAGSQHAPRPGGDSSNYRNCPFCAEAIRREAIKCRYCQSDVVALPALERSITKPQPAPVPFYYTFDPSILAALTAGVSLVCWLIWMGLARQAGH